MASGHGKKLLLGAIAVLLIGAVVIALFVEPVISTADRARLPTCRIYLKHLGLAMHNYQEAHGCFPPAYIADAEGRPMHSWRVLILPYIDRQDLYQQYDFSQPWDSPANLKLLEEIPQEYRCPSDRRQNRTGPEAVVRETSYVALLAPDGIFPGAKPCTLEEIADGPSHTILLAECSQTGIPWTKPEDLQLTRPILPGTLGGLRSDHEGRVNILLADGQVDALSEETSPETLEALITKSGGERVERP